MTIIVITIITVIIIKALVLLCMTMMRNPVVVEENAGYP